MIQRLLRSNPQIFSTLKGFATCRHTSDDSDSMPVHDSEEQSANFLELFNRRQKPEQRTIEYFTSLDWVRNLLQDEAYKAVPFFSRYHNERTGEHRFFAQTVNTETTIPHLLAFRLKDLKAPTE